MKDVLPSDLVAAIRTVNRGEAQLDPEIARKVMQEFANPQPATPKHDLTDRELEVLRLIAQGKSNKDISENLVSAKRRSKRT